MTDEVRVPGAPTGQSSTEELRDYAMQLHQWLSAREPLADGALLDKFLTGRQALALGIGSLQVGTGAFTGGNGDVLIPGPGTTNPGDTSPPSAIAGLIVTPGPTFFFVEFDAPIYQQGGSNGRTVIYAATYSGTGPLPTFGDAIEIFQCFGSATIAVIDAEPGVQMHFWVKAETRAGTLQADPTGGINGVYAVCGKIDGAEHIEALSVGTAQIADLAVTNAKIVNMSVAKLIAGALSVGEYIESTGYVPGLDGFRITGEGAAEFQSIIARGAIYATSGTFAGVTINGALTFNTTGHLKGGQTDYNTGTGFWQGYSGGQYKFSIGSATAGLTWNGTALDIKGTLTTGASPAVSGTTMTGSGAVFNVGGTFALGDSTRNFTYNGTTFKLNGDLVATGNIVSESVSANYFDTIAERVVTNAGIATMTSTVESSRHTVQYGVLETFAIFNARVRLRTTNARWLRVTVTPELFHSSGTWVQDREPIKLDFHAIPTADVDNMIAVSLPAVFNEITLGQAYWVRYTFSASCYAKDSSLQPNMVEMTISGFLQVINRKV